MKYLIATIITTLMFLGAAQAADYQKGLDAYDAGNYTMAISEYKKLAEKGDAASPLTQNLQHLIGSMYNEGKGVTKDDGEAVKWWRKAAEQGYADAQVDLGTAYMNGRGVILDHAEAMKWWRMAAEQGVTEALSKIGAVYYKGRGVTKNYVEAMKWYRKAGEQGDALAQTIIGYMYTIGEGVLQNNVTAHMWYNIAGARGNKMGVTGRDIIAKAMTPAAIEKAQRRAKICMKSNYKNCD